MRNKLLLLVKKALLNIIDDIDAGNSDSTEDECIEALEYLSYFTNKNEKISKYQACKYLKISRATFDNYVRCGKLPKGRKQQGFKELY